MTKHIKLDDFESELGGIISDTLSDEMLAKGFMDWLDQSSPLAKDIKQNKNSVKITFTGLTAYARSNQSDFFDLKPYFAKSDKAKQRVNSKGEPIPNSWYLTIPVRTNMNKIQQGVPRSLYDDLVNSPFGTTIDLDAATLQNATGTDQSMVLDSLKYDWKSGNVTKEPSNNTNNSQFVSFRTVSDKSSPSSWIVGRQNATKNDPELTPAMKRDINRAMDYKVKLYMSHITHTE